MCLIVNKLEKEIMDNIFLSFSVITVLLNKYLVLLRENCVVVNLKNGMGEAVYRLLSIGKGQKVIIRI